MMCSFTAVIMIEVQIAPYHSEGSAQRGQPHLQVALSLQKGTISLRIRLTLKGDDAIAHL